MDFEIEFSKWYPMTKLDWEANVRSIQDVDFPWKWVGSSMICCSPNLEVMASILEPSKVVVSPVSQFLDFESKPPMSRTEKGLVTKIASRFCWKI